MATTTIQVRQGQQITSTSQEQELQPRAGEKHGTAWGFIVTSGSVQVTVAARGTQDAIGGQIAAFSNTTPIFMAVEQTQTGDNREGRNLFIKGTGTIVVFWV